MSHRISYAQTHKLQPAISQHLIALGQAAAQSLSPQLVHLVKLRASQLNGCAFCQHMHANEARRDGELQHRLDLLPAWSEVSALFTEQEQAALHWTERLTLQANQAPGAEDYQRVAQQFTEQQLVDLTAVIMTINAWNRLAVAFHFQPAL